MPVALPWAELKWLNEPDWTADNDVLKVRTAPETDFWRLTHYGFVRDSGHFLHTRPLGEFTAQVRAEGTYEALYDQAGLMVRSHPGCWVKAGIEFVHGQRLSAVVTREYSDWSVQPTGNPAFVDLKITRRGDTLQVQSRLPGADWALLRLAYYPPEEPAAVGVYACSPQRGGFEVRFSGWRVGAPETESPY